MKERPILFSGAMVRALLSGTKTQTRRIVKPQPQTAEGMNCTRLRFLDKRGEVFIDEALEAPTPHLRNILCPYGRPGDRLWVRENGWERPSRTPKMMRNGAGTWEHYYFDADGLSDQDVSDFKAWGFKRRPSIHMPRAASRITLEVTEVRVERLQDISKADAIAEGIEPDVQPGDRAELWRNYATGGTTASPVYSYETLWASINGQESWDVNPWVWCVSFRRIDQ